MVGKSQDPTLWSPGFPPPFSLFRAPDRRNLTPLINTFDEKFFLTSAKLHKTSNCEKAPS
jgi:hypothetical protein